MTFNNKSFLPSNNTNETNQVNHPKGTDQYVIPHKDGWAVTSNKESKAEFIYPLKQYALTKARLIAQKLQSNLYIFKRDGSFQHKISYQLR